MEKLTNKEIYDKLISTMPKDLGNSFPSYEEALRLNLINIDMNSFIETICNKIGKMLYIEQHFSNPFNELFYGEMPFGYSIEELFLEDSTVQSLLDGDEKEVFNSSLPRLNGLVANSRFDKKVKMTLSAERLKSAFLKEFGLYDLISKMLSNLKTSMSKDKYKEIEKALKEFVKGLDSNGENLNFKQAPYKEVVSSNLIESIVKIVEEFTLPSDKYNPSKFNTQCLKSDIIIFVKSEIYAKLVSSDSILLRGEYNIKSISDLPTDITNLSTNDTINPVALIMDKRLMPIMLNYNGLDRIDDPNSLTTNYYYYENYSLPVNTFSNFAILTSE